MKYIVTVGGREIEVEVDGDQVTVGRAHGHRHACARARHAAPATCWWTAGRSALAVEGGGAGRWALTRAGRAVGRRGAGRAHPAHPRPHRQRRPRPRPGRAQGADARAGRAGAGRRPGRPWPPAPGIVVLEAMKMENELRAAGTGGHQDGAGPAGRGGRKGPGPGRVRVDRARRQSTLEVLEDVHSPGARQPARRPGVPAAVLPSEAVARIPCSTCTTGRTCSTPRPASPASGGSGGSMTPRRAGASRRSWSASPTWVPERLDGVQPVRRRGRGGGRGDRVRRLRGEHAQAGSWTSGSAPGRARSDTVIAGSSMGGLISLYAAVPASRDVFGAAGVLSPSLWFAGGAIFSEVEPLPVRARPDLSRHRHAGRGRARGQRAPDARPPAEPRATGSGATCAGWSRAAGGTTSAPGAGGSPGRSRFSSRAA